MVGHSTLHVCLCRALWPTMYTQFSLYWMSCLLWNMQAKIFPYSLMFSPFMSHCSFSWSLALSISGLVLRSGLSLTFLTFFSALQWKIKCVSFSNFRLLHILQNLFLRSSFLYLTFSISRGKIPHNSFEIRLHSFLGQSA